MAKFIYPPTADQSGLTEEVTIPLGGTGATTAEQAADNLTAIKKRDIGTQNGPVPTKKGVIPSEYLSVAPNAPVPTVSGQTVVYGGSTNVYTITNYDSLTTYNVVPVSGTAVVSGDSISYTAPLSGNAGFTVNGKLVTVTIAKPVGDIYNENTSIPYGSQITAMSADGMYAAVGQYSFNSAMGRIYIYKFNGSSWGLFNSVDGGSDNTNNDVLGGNFDLSGDGTYLACACAGTKRVKVFIRTGTFYTLQDTFRHEGPGIDRYGQNVIISRDGNYVVTNQHTVDASTGVSPYIDIWKRVGDKWHLQATVRGTGWTDATPNHGVGGHMAINADGSILAVGDYWYNDPQSSRINVFRRVADSWGEEAVITLPDGERTNRMLGTDIAISGDGNTILAGAINTVSGMTEYVYVFKRKSATWDSFYIDAKLSPANGVIPAGQTSLRFGYTVNMSDSADRILVSGYMDSQYGNQVGAVWVFDYVYTQSSWFQRQIIRPYQGVASGCFGAGMSASADVSKVMVSTNDGSPGNYSRFFGL